MVIRLGIATLLGGLIGLERERLERAAGLRTHALVAVGSALIMIVSTYGFPKSAGEVLDPSRIAAQVVSGIGFLGAGVIIFRENSVRGLTTAATVWCVAGIGLAVGGGLYAPAIVGTAFMLVVQAGLKPVERRFFSRHAQQHRLMMEVLHGSDVLSEIEHALVDTRVRIRSLDFDRSDHFGLDTLEITLVADREQEVMEAIRSLQSSSSIKRIHYARGGSTIRRQERTIPRTRSTDDVEPDDVEPDDVEAESDVDDDALDLLQNGRAR